MRSSDEGLTADSLGVISSQESAKTFGLCGYNRIFVGMYDGRITAQDTMGVDIVQGTKSDQLRDKPRSFRQFVPLLKSTSCEHSLALSGLYI